MLFCLFLPLFIVLVTLGSSEWHHYPLDGRTDPNILDGVISSGPPPLYGATLAVLESGVYMFGGKNAQGDTLNELWVLSNFSSWINPNWLGGPSHRFLHSVTKVSRTSFALYGGNLLGGSDEWGAELYLFDVAVGWTLLMPGQTLLEEYLTPQIGGRKGSCMWNVHSADTDTNTVYVALGEGCDTTTCVKVDLPLSYPVWHFDVEDGTGWEFDAVVEVSSEGNSISAEGLAHWASGEFLFILGGDLCAVVRYDTTFATGNHTWDFVGGGICTVPDLSMPRGPRRVQDGTGLQFGLLGVVYGGERLTDDACFGDLWLYDHLTNQWEFLEIPGTHDRNFQGQISGTDAFPSFPAARNKFAAGTAIRNGIPQLWLYGGQDYGTQAFYDTWSFTYDLCLNGGLCTDEVTCDPCQCSEGWEGSRCEMEIAPWWNNVWVIAGIGGAAGGVVLLLVILAIVICLVCVIRKSCVGGREAKRGSGTRGSTTGRESELPTLEIDSALFTIDYDDVRLIEDIGLLFSPKVFINFIFPTEGTGGGGAVVFKAEWQDQIVAMKVFRTRQLCSDEDAFEEFESELKIMANVSHPNLVRFFGASLKPPRVGLVMEYCSNGDLHEVIGSKRLLQEPKERLRVLHEIASAMKYLHSNRIVHRDLKPENVLCDKLLSAKVMDFGVSRIAGKKMTTRVGTQDYMAPELVGFMANGQYSFSVDVYSYGILMYVALSGNFTPYKDVSTSFQSAVDPQIRPSIDRVALFRDPKFQWVVELMKRCWEASSEARPTMDRICTVFRQHADKKPESGRNGFQFILVSKAREQMSAFLPRSDSQLSMSLSPTAPVFLNVKCSNVANSQGEAANPAVVVSLRNSRSGEWASVGSTECQTNVWSPQFMKEVTVQYRIAAEQFVLLQLYDVSRGSDFDGVPDEGSDTVLGYMTVRLSDLFHAKKTGLTRTLQNPSSSPTGTTLISMTVRVSDYPSSGSVDVSRRSDSLITFRLRATHLKKRDLLGQSDPYFVIRKPKKKKKKKGKALWTSETKTSDANPVWKPCTLELAKLTPKQKKVPHLAFQSQRSGSRRRGGQEARIGGDDFRIEVYDHDVGREDDLIGFVELTVADLRKTRVSSGFELSYWSHGELLTSDRGTLFCDACRIHSKLENEDQQPFVSLNLRGEGLKNADILGKSDPFFVISRCVERQVFDFSHKSEVKMNDLNPYWDPISLPLSTFSFDQSMEEKFLVEVYDYDAAKKDDLIGSVQVTLEELRVRGRTSGFELSYVRKGSQLPDRGKIFCDIVRVDPKRREAPTGQLVTFNLRGVNLKKMDVLSNTDGYFVIRKSFGNGVCSAVRAHSSSVIGGSLNPSWDPVSLDFSQLTFSGAVNPDEKFRIDVFDSNEALKDQLVGSVDVSVSELQSHGSEGFELKCVDRKGTVLPERGRVCCDVCRVDPTPHRKPSNQIVTFNLRGVDLKKLDVLTLSDPFFVLRRLIGPGVPMGEFAKSEVVQNNQDPFWMPVSIDTSEFTFLGNHDDFLDAKFRIEVFDANVVSGASLIGFVDVSISELLREQSAGGRDEERGFGLTCFGKKGQVLPGRGFLLCDVCRIDPKVPRIGHRTASNQMVSFNLRGVNLKKLDVLSQSDPYFIFRHLIGPGVPMYQFAKSEVVQNHQNPGWLPQTIDCSEFTFLGNTDLEEKFRVEVFDANAVSGDVLIGYVDVSLSELSEQSQTTGEMRRGFELICYGKKKQRRGEPLPDRGVVFCDVLRIDPKWGRTKTNDIVTFNLRGLALKRMDLIGGADPYFVFRRLLCPQEGREGPFVPMKGSFAKSEVKNNTLHPSWEPVSIDSSEFSFLGNPDLQAKFRIEVFDSDAMSADDQIGWCDTSIAELQTIASTGGESSVFELNFFNKKGQQLPDRGRIACDVVRIDPVSTRKKTNQIVSFNLRGANIKKLDLLSNSDPYFVLRRLVAPGLRGVASPGNFGKSEVKDNDPNPGWMPKSIDSSEFTFLGNEDLSEKFRVEVFNSNALTSDAMIGWCDVSIAELQSQSAAAAAGDASSSLGFELMCYDKKGQQLLPNRGFVFCDACRVDPLFVRRPCQQIVTFNFRGKSFKRMDLIGGADPYFVLRRLLCSTLSEGGESTTCPPIGVPMDSFCKSEVINNTLNPIWEPVSIDFSEMTFAGVPDPHEKFRVEVFDSDGLSDDDLIGYFDVSVAELMQQSESFEEEEGGEEGVREREGWELTCFNKKRRQLPNRGRVFCDVCRIDSPRKPRTDKITFILRGEEIKKMDVASKSDCYFVLKTGVGNGVFKHAFKSEVEKNTTDPTWGPLFLEVGLFTFGGSPDEPLRIEVYDHNTIAKDKLIGYADTTMRLLQTRGVDGWELQFFNAKGKKLPNRGMLFCDLCRADPPRPIRPEIVTFNLRGNVKKLDLLTASDPYFLLKVGLGNGGFMQTFKSPVKKNTNTPHWVVSAKYMDCTYLGNPDEPLRIEVWDADVIGRGKRIGHFDTSLVMLQSCCVEEGDQHPFELICMKRGRSLPKRGTLFCDVCRIDMPEPSRGGEVFEPSILFNLRGENLKRMDFLARSDPYFHVRPQVGNGVFLTEPTHTSEVIKQNLNPLWEPLRLMYSKLFFRLDEADPTTKFRIDVYDRDIGSSDDYIGYADVSIQDLQTSANSERSVGFELTCINKKGKRLPRRGHLFCDVCVVTEHPKPRPPDENVKFKLRGVNFKKMDIGPLGKADPYFVIRRGLGNGVYAFAHKGPTIRSTLNPEWESLTMPVRSLTLSGSISDKFRIEVYDHDDLGDNDLIGHADVSIRDLRDSARSHGERSFELYYENTKGRVLPDRGRLVCVECKLEGSRYSLSQYIEGGLEVCLSMAIDFTATNGDPRMPGTLHHLADDPGMMNDYECAIHMIGGMLMKLDSDNVCPVYGFGAKSKNQQGMLSDCFALNGKAAAPCCVGVEGVLAAYRNAVRSVELSGPSRLSYVTQVATQQAAAIPVCQDVQVYNILVIFTNGMLDPSDAAATLEAFVASSHAPLSILIVGVGGQDFSAMKFLDADDDLLWTASGNVAARDNCEFVPFYKVRFAGPTELSKKTLKEISNQAQSYLRERDIFPNQPTEWVPIPGVQRAVGHQGDDEEEEGEVEIVVDVTSAAAGGASPSAPAVPDCLVTGGHVDLIPLPLSEMGSAAAAAVMIETLISYADLRRKLRAAGPKLVVLFVTASWVAPSVSTVYDGLPAQYSHAEFYKMFTTKKRLMKKLRVKKVPTFLIYRNNKLLHKINDGPGNLVLKLKSL